LFFGNFFLGVGLSFNDEKNFSAHIFKYENVFNQTLNGRG